MLQHILFSIVCQFLRVYVQKGISSSMKTINEKLSEFLINYANEIAADTVDSEKNAFVKNLSSLTRKLFKAHEKELRKELRSKSSLRPTISCVIDGVNYTSIYAAGNALNMRYSVVTNRLKSHYWPTWTSTEVKKELKIREKKTKPLPCTIDGVDYVSIAEAARQLNISTGSVFFKLHSSKHPNWKVSE